MVPQHFVPQQCSHLQYSLVLLHRHHVATPRGIQDDMNPTDPAFTHRWHSTDCGRGTIDIL
jgi:hypothetical protein